MTDIENLNFDAEEQNTIFNRDISSQLPEKVREKLASYLQQVTQEDIESRKPWLDVIGKVKPYLGFFLKEEFDEKLQPFKHATQTFDTTFSTAVLRLWALLRSELLPNTGPVGFKNTISNSDAFQLQAEKIRDFLNIYLTTEDKGFYPDYNRFLLYLLVYGCVFRKIYFDSVTGLPVSRFIAPEDFLVDNNCSSILESDRLTHIRKLSKREILINMQNGIFRKTKLDYLKDKQNNDDNLNSANNDRNENATINLDIYSTSSRFTFYETHAYLDLNEFFDENDNTDEISKNFALPSPYVIVRCEATNEIVSLIPNWHENDPLRQRINVFVHYNLFPGFDIYGLGLAQILGSNAISLTKMLRQSIDAAIFQNLPGGMVDKGFKIQNNNMTVGPGQWIQVDSGGIPLSDGFFSLPYKGPSPALLELATRVIEQTRELASTTEVGITDNSQETPVGTTMAALEVANRMQSAILRNIHDSFSDEIQLLYEMFQNTAFERAFIQNGQEEFINNNDFSSEITVIPVSDPTTNTVTQRIAKAESLLKIASTAPQMHNMKEIYKRVYEALGIEDLDRMFAPEPPTEEGSEQNIDSNALLAADIDQKNKETEAKERIAAQKAETDVFKAQLLFEMNKTKLEMERYVADLKNETETLKAKLAYEGNREKLNLDEQIAKLKAEVDLLKNNLKQEETYE